MVVEMERIFTSWVWVGAVAFLLAKNTRTSRIIYRVQSLGEAGLMGSYAWGAHSVGLWTSAGLIVVVKAGIIPHQVARRTIRMEQQYGSQSFVGLASMLVLAFVLTSGTLYVAAASHMPHVLKMGLLLAGVLVVFMQLVGRYELWSQLWALLSLETLATSLVLVILNALPLVVDAGLDVAAWLLATVLAILVARAQHLFGTDDSRALTGLRG